MRPAARRVGPAGAVRPPEAGVTLVELLIAVALLGFILLGIAPLFLGSMKANFSANEYTNIHIKARDRLEQLSNLPFTDPQLRPGGHLNYELPRFHLPWNPAPASVAELSDVRNPFTVTYEVFQYAIPPAGPMGGADVPVSGAPFTPVLVTLSGRIYHYKRIDVTVRSNTGTLGIGTRLARISGFVNNPSPAKRIEDCALPPSAGIICSVIPVTPL